MAMNKARRTANLNNILTYDTLGNSTLIANLTVEGLTNAGFVKADVNGLLSVDINAYITLNSGLTGFTVGSATEISAADTVLQAFGKIQGQLNAIPDVNVITGTGTSGQVAYFTGATTQGGSNNLFWDNTNGRLGINTASPNTAIGVSGNITIQNSSGSSNYSRFGVVNAGTDNATFIGSITNNNFLLYSANAERARITNTGNFHIGTFTADSGQRLQVTGDTLLKGSGNTSATNALNIQNSDGTNTFRFRNDGVLRLGSSGSGFTMSPASGPSYAIDIAGTNVSFSSATTTQDCSLGRFLFSGGILSRNTDNVISGSIGSLSTFAPTAGNGRFFELLLQSTINQTGTATGITRGLYVNPTLTAAADWRSIEWSNNTGWGLYGVGTSLNYLNGNLLLGSTTNSGQRLQVTGDTLLRGSGNTSATTALTVQNSASAALMSISNDAANTQLNITGSTTAYFRANQTTANRFVQYGSNATTADFYVGSAITAYTFSNNGGYVLMKINTAPFPTAGGNLVEIPAISTAFSPTSGSADFTALIMRPVINQTGGANGITRGLYVNPTLTAAADWRSIEWSNNTGWGLYGAGTAQNYLAGSLGIGSTSFTGISLRVGKNITGGTTGVGIASNGNIQNDVTANAILVVASAFSNVSGFTTTNFYHYLANRGTISHTVTNAYGYFVDTTVDYATNNYGFYGNIASGTNRWNLYMNGTANNYMAGQVAIGHALVPDPAGAWQRALVIGNTGANKIIAGYLGSATNGATIGANNSALNAWADLNIAGSNLIFRANGETEGMRLNSARNLLIGSTTDSGEKLQVTGTMKVTGASSFGGNMTLALNQNASTTITISNTTSGITANSYFRATASGGSVDFGKFSAGSNPYRIIAANDAFISNGSVGDIAILNGNTSGSIKFAAGDSAGAHLTIASTGAATFTSSVTSTTFNGNTQNIFSVGGTEGMRLTATNRNLHIGTFSSDSGERLQVTGTAKITGAVSSNVVFRTNHTGTGNEMTYIGERGGGVNGGYIQLRNANVVTVGIDSNGASFFNGGNVAFDTNTFFVDAAANSVAVGTATINASAKLQIDSTTQGFLPPRMTAAQRTAIATPPEGLIVFQSDGVVGLYLYVNSAWKSLAIVN